MPFKNFPTPHCHINSLDSASTPEAFADREVELGTGTLTITDHGSMATCRQVYDLAQQKKLTPILGLEGYFRDDDDPILKQAGISNNATDAHGNREYYKYAHLTIHFLDQDAYHTGCRVLSDADLRAERHGSERKPLFTWAHIEQLAEKNVVFSSSCLVGVVGRHLLADRPDLAISYYERFRSMVRPGNWFVEIFPHRCDKDWVSGCFLTLKRDQDARVKFWPGKKLRIEMEGATTDLKAEDLVLMFARKHPTIKLVARKDQQTWVDVEPVEILNAEQVEEFMPNECRPWAPDGDVQRGMNLFMLRLAKKYGDPVYISDDSHYVRPDEKMVQDVRLMSNGNTWRFYGHYHRHSSDEAWEYFKTLPGVNQAQFEGWIENGFRWAEKFKDFKFETRKSLPTSFYPKDTLLHTKRLIDKHGRMDWRNQAWRERLKSEFDLLYANGTIDLLPYFMIDEEVCDLYTRHGELTGPGRGSAAGLLLTYLIGITHVDPLRYKLSRDRFMTPDRIKSGKLPDIDQDLPHRDLLVGPRKEWLKERFGDCFAQISTDTLLRIKSSIKDVHRVMHGGVSGEIEALCKKIPNPPMGIDDYDYVFGYKDSSEKEVKGIAETNKDLQNYITKYPKEWDTVVKCLGLTRQKSRHACAYVISDEPIQNFIPLVTVGDVRVTSYTAKWVEAVGGLKMDFLIVNSLKDIAQALKLVQRRNPQGVDWSQTDRVIPPEEPIPSMRIDGKQVPLIRCVPHKGRFYDIWDLPEDQSVFRDVCECRTQAVFQLDKGAKVWLPKFMGQDGRHAIRSIEDMSAFTALDRPGPLDAQVSNGAVSRNMLEEFAARARGEEPIGAVPILDKMLPESYGVIVYQEQLQEVFRVVGGVDGIQANQFRDDIGKKRMKKVMKWKETFMPNAIKTLGAEEAQRLWDMMETFGQYGFNKSHSTCYMVIAYACAWIKHHYPLEWWTAVMSNAERKEIETKFWGYCGHLIDPPDIKLSKADFDIQGERIRAPMWLLNGVGPAAAQELDEVAQGEPLKDIQDFCDRIYQRRVRLAKPDEKKPEKLKLGRSNLNRTVIARLIISGTLDSLFPPGMADYDKFNAYAEAERVASNAKKPKDLDIRFLHMSPIQRYQLRKGTLTSFGMDLRPMVARMNPRPEIIEGDEAHMVFVGRVFGDERDRKFACVSAEDLDILATKLDILGEAIKVAVIGYVADTRPFTYQGNKQACEITLDVDGTTFSYVKWPNRDGKLEGVPKGLKGSVVAAALIRFNESKPFVLDEIAVIQAPLDLKSKEESS